MSSRLIDRTIAAQCQPPPRTSSAPDPAYESLSSLTRLRDQLIEACTGRTASEWEEAPLFFFDQQRQAEIDSARPTPTSDICTDYSAAIETALTSLFASIEVRRVARALDGLVDAARTLAPLCAAARDLADLLSIPEDEVFLVLDPDRRAGFRLLVRGVADVGQFHILLAHAVVGDPAAGFLPEPAIAPRFVAACRDPNPTTPGGVPLVAQARFQLHTPAAFSPDGTLPDGLGGCEHWLWPEMSLDVIPRINGERVIAIGPPAFALTWDTSRRFPGLPADLSVIETLSSMRVAEYLSNLVGSFGSPQPAVVLSKAA